jgi:AcrR family transcriptional regulator
MDMSSKIRKAFVEYVLENEQAPKSIYKLAKSVKLKEEEFYEHYTSIAAIENDIWRGFFEETRKRIESEEVYASYSVREKMLAFYYTWIEVLKANRSYVASIYHEHKSSMKVPAFFESFKEEFHDYTENLILEGRETQEITERPYIVDMYPKIFWTQALLILRFWVKDLSPNFEKTDVYVEKAVNFAFDVMGKTSLDSAFDFFKYAFQNR